MIAVHAEAAPFEEPEGEPITIGHRHTIESKALNETRSYIVHKPGGYDFSNDAYPLIILLDGDANIHHVSATVDSLANNGRALPMIVVGIENTDRQRDLTPPITDAKWEDAPVGTVGGAAKFLSFIADELIPHLDRSYRTRPIRILIGHSYGGLFAVYTLFNRPELFKAYIAVSPALSWDNQALARQADRFVTEHAGLQLAVYMTMGNESGAMLGGAQKVAGSLAGSRTIDVSFQRWPEESHGSVVLPSVYKGMEWLHQAYYTHDPVRVYEESGLQSLDKKFAAISGYLGYEVKIPEQVLMHIQLYLTEANRPEEARQVLHKVLQLYPNHTGPHLELGRNYLHSNDKPRAEEQFKRVLELYPGSSEARSELAKMGSDPRLIVVDAKVPPTVLRSYAGEYRYSDETSRVTFENGKLFIKVRNDTRELRPRSDVSFYTMDFDREYQFHQKSGKAVSMTVHLPDFSYQGQKVR